MRRIGIVAVLAILLLAFSASAALAVAPGTYTPTADSFNSANAPGSSHLASGTPQCVVNADLDVDCSAYVLGGVGNTNATVRLVATYSATIDCTNRGGNLVESHTATFSDSSTATVASTSERVCGATADSVPVMSTTPSNAPESGSWNGTAVQLQGWTDRL